MVEQTVDLARRFDAIGYGIYATEGTAKFLNEHGVHATLVNKLGENDDNDIPALVRTGKAQAIINTVGNKRTYDEDGAAYSRAAKAHTHDNEGIRLQKLLAQAGFIIFFFRFSRISPSIIPFPSSNF